MRTYWRGAETPARRVRAKIGPVPNAGWWCADRAGEIVDAVEVSTPELVFLLDDTDGHAWNIVTEKGGSPAYGYRRLPPRSEVVDER